MTLFVLVGTMSEIDFSEVVGVYASAPLAREAAQRVKDNYYMMVIEQYILNAPAVDCSKGEDDNIVTEIL